ncbi:MAG: hypothetical protein U0228_01470 [Myxococcaceae bacterium]
MFALALALVVQVAPGLSLDAHPSVRLLDQADTTFTPSAPPPLITAEPDAPTPQTTQLAAVRTEPMPSLALPITLLAVGVGATATGAVLAYYGMLSLIVGSFGRVGSLAAGAAVALVLGAALTIGGVVMIVIGVKGLVTGIKERQKRTREIRTLERQLKSGASLEPFAPLDGGGVVLAVW